MEIPANAEVHDSATGLYWIEKNGLVCAISKKAPPQTLEQAKKATDDFKKVIKGKKVCMLFDITNTTPTSKEVRDYSSAEMPNMVKAIAMICHSAMARMMANLFLGLKSPSYPIKMFSDEAEARNWLEQYIE